MDLEKHYHKLYIESIEKILSDDYQTDKRIDAVSDNRYGITLLVRPDIQIKNKIQGFLNELQKIDPTQYYYPNSDIHITILSIISCYDGFDLANLSVPDYVTIIEKSLAGIKDTEISFRGITASAAAIMIQGFTNNTDLDNFRSNLRDGFKNSKLEQSIDKRYSIASFHSTVVRFRNKIKNKDSLLTILDNYRDHDFGTFKIKQFELVCNDWYQREQFTQELHVFKL